MENKDFSHEDGFKTIYAMIESAKGRIGENYMYYLLWGYLVMTACIAEYLLIEVIKYNNHQIVWPVLMGIGFFVSLMFTWRQKRKTRSRSFIGNVMGYLWGGWFISFLIMMVFTNLRHDYETILPMTLVFYGLGIFISGGVIDFKPLMIGGIIAWAASVFCFFQPYTIQLPVMAIVLLVSYVIPGHMLRTLSKQQS